MNANPTPGQFSTTQLTTLSVFDDLRDHKSLDLREVGRGGGDRTQHPGDLVWVPAHNLEWNQIALPKTNDSCGIAASDSDQC